MSCLAKNELLLISIGLKHYIASEDQGITTSAGHVRNLFGRCIELGRQYGRSGNKADLYEAFRLLGTGCHCLEDYSAHSNYVELALIELGEREVFPHVGRRTQVRLPGVRQPVYPIITGTFGGTDFLHSVMGEFSDKATQSEIQELQGTIESSQSSQNDFSLLQDLLSKLPSGLFGGEDQAGKVDELQSNAQAAQMQNTHISPREPEAWARQLGEISKQIYPIVEWHDGIMETLNETIEKIPVLPELLEQLTEQVNIFVFSLLAPFVVPIINQVKNELATGSSEIIQSSRDKQHIVFHNDNCSDPTHSMLSKDHFSNILNEPAGKTASQVLKWVVPQIMSCWDDPRIDIGRTLNRIIAGVFHHPAQRDYGDDGAADCRRAMIAVVEQWWNQKDENEKQFTRDQLSRDGVEQGRNHKEGVHDSGHGCGKPLGMPTMGTAASSGAIGGLPVGNILGKIGSALQGQSQFDTGASLSSGGASSAGVGKFAEDAVGGGALGGIVGGIVGGIGGDLLGGAFGSQKKTYQSGFQNDDGSFTQSYAQTGYSQPQGGQRRYGEAEFNETAYPGGGRQQEFDRVEQSSGGYGRTYEQRTTFESSSGYQSEVRQEFSSSGGGTYGGEYESQIQGSDSDEERKKHKHKKKHGKHHSSDSDSAEGKRYEQESYGQGSYGREERSTYGGREESYDSGEGYGGGYGGQRREEERMPGGFGGGEEYVSERPAYGSGFGGQREEYGGGYGGGGGEYGSRGLGEDAGERGFEREEREVEREEEYGGRRDDDEGGFGGEGYSDRRGYGDDY